MFPTLQDYLHPLSWYLELLKPRKSKGFYGEWGLCGRVEYKNRFLLIILVVILCKVASWVVKNRMQVWGGIARRLEAGEPFLCSPWSLQGCGRHHLLQGRRKAEALITKGGFLSRTGRYKRRTTRPAISPISLEKVWILNLSVLVHGWILENLLDRQRKPECRFLLVDVKDVLCCS